MMKNVSPYLLPGCVILLLLCTLTDAKDGDVIQVYDLKEWKKIIKTRTNVLGTFGTTRQSLKDVFPLLESVAMAIKGKGTILVVDCKEAKKLCKNLKVKPAEHSKDYILKHYQSGSFNKDYDRQFTVSSMVSFMENPTADPPWSEDETASDVRHISNPNQFYKTVKKEKKPILAMFYAPWCGVCKMMKPEFAAAATRLKDKAVLIGMDVDTQQGYMVQQDFNITGFPTTWYFENGERKFKYWDKRTADVIVEWMGNPRPQPEDDEGAGSSKEEQWDTEGTEVAHLTADTFDEFISSNPSVLVMFYAPWCGHCKALKPDFVKAANIMKEEGIEGRLAAVDATAHTTLGSQYKVRSYPTLKYFQNGELKYDYASARSLDALVQYMKDPQPPPPPEPDWSEMETKVTHLDDETFKSFLKKKKNALVFYYAPWCGHCKAAKPHFAAAAEEIVDKKSTLAAVDCTKYKSICTEEGVEGFPTIKFYSYGKKGFKYMGPRNQEGFVDFMKNPMAFDPRNEL